MLSKFIHCFSAHMQAVSFASAVQPLFLLPQGNEGIVNSYVVSPQQWSIPTRPHFYQEIQNQNFQLMAAGHTSHSLHSEPSVIFNQPPHLPSESEAANEESLQSTEGSVSLDTTKREPLEPLSVDSAIAKGQATHPEFFFLKKICNKGTVLEVTPERMHQVAGCGYISVARILFSLDEPPSLIYDVQVLLTSIETGSVTNLDQFISVCSKISNGAQYKFCPGLDVMLYYDTYFATIHYHIKSMRVWEKPFSRIDSKDCALWH